jgi:hypothetical protein
MEDVIMTKYSNITIFTKAGTLTPYLEHAKHIKNVTELGRKYYEKEREIQLILATRWDSTAKRKRLMGKISCPVNPLPVRGEFEIASYNAMCEFLMSQGWTLKETISNHWFEE